MQSMFDYFQRTNFTLLQCSLLAHFPIQELQETHDVPKKSDHNSNDVKEDRHPKVLRGLSEGGCT